MTFENKAISVPECLAKWRDASTEQAPAALAVKPLHRAAEFPQLVCWVAEEHPDERTHSDMSRYLCFVAHNEQQRDNGNMDDIIYAGESEVELQAALEAADYVA